MSKPHGVPERTCLSCRRRKAKKDLIRHVWSGQFTPDVAAILPGRGYYCCAEPACQAVFARRAAAVRKRKGEGKRDEA
jgi:hypothetical protein